MAWLRAPLILTFRAGRGIKVLPYSVAGTQSSQLASTVKVGIMGKFVHFLLVRTQAMLVRVTLMGPVSQAKFL